MKSLNSSQLILSTVVALVFGTVLGYVFGFNQGAGLEKSSSQPSHIPMNFEECIAAGNPAMESYPRQCRTSDGRHFVESIKPEPLPPPKGGSSAITCLPAGCSGTICAKAEDAANIVTTCEFRAEYACYPLTKCEVQSDGACGWTETSKFKACLSNPPALQ